MPRRRNHQPALFAPAAVRSIPEEVAHRMHGFEHRHAARVEKRKTNRQRWNAMPPELKRKAVKKEKPNVRAIKVTFRAVFEQPIGKLNPSEFKLPGPRPVEVFSGKSGKWAVRSLEAARPVVLEKLGTDFISPDAAKLAAESVYLRRVQPWQIWGTPPGSPVAVQLQAEDIVKLPGDHYAWKEAEDFTHILHAPTMEPSQRKTLAACGADVPAKAFINNKANVEPSCARCAEVWREHYAKKEAATR